MSGWDKGAGADKVPVLPHVFGEWCEECMASHFDNDGACMLCERCKKMIRPLDFEDRCPARPGQERGFLQ